MGLTPHRHLVPKILEKSRAKPLLTPRACVAYKKGENLPKRNMHRALFSICELRQNGIRDDRTFLVCKSQNVKFTPEQNLKAQRGSRDISLFFLFP